MNGRSLLRSKDGRPHLIWMWLMGFAIYALWVWGTDVIFLHTLGRIQDLAHEGVLFQTPMWETFQTHGWAPLASIVESAGLILIFTWLDHRLHLHDHHEKFDHRICTRWVAVGFLSALAGILLCLLTDSLRLEAPFSMPRFTLSTLFAFPEIFLATRAGEVFMMDYLYDGARLHIPRPAALILLIVVEFIADTGWKLSWIGMINLILQVTVVTELHERYGLAAAAGLWFGWDYVLSALMVVEGEGVWTLYRVSEPWLTGGHHGLFEGVWMTVVILGIMGYLWLRAHWKPLMRKDG